MEIVVFMPKGRIITDRSVTDALVGELAGAGARKTEKYGDRAAGRQIHRYVSAALVLATPYLFTNCSDSTGPPDPNGNGNGKNNAPSATVNIDQPRGIIYTDSNGDVVINVNYSDRDGDPENTGKRETWFERNDQRLSQYDGRTSVPLSAFSPQAGTKIEGCARVHDGHDYSAPACASKIVQGIPYRNIVVPVDYYWNKAGISDVLVLLHSDSTMTDNSGNASFQFDERNGIPTSAMLRIPHNILYSIDARRNLNNGVTAPPMVERYTEPGTGVDLMDHFRFMVGARRIGGLKKGWLNSAWPLNFYGGDNEQPIPGLADAAFQGCSMWGNAAGVQALRRVYSAENADITVVFGDHRDTYAERIASDDATYTVGGVIHFPQTLSSVSGTDRVAAHECGHVFGLIEEDTTAVHSNRDNYANYIMTPGGITISPIEVLMFRLLYALPNLTNLNEYAEQVWGATYPGGSFGGSSQAFLRNQEGRTVYGPEDAQFVGPVRMVVPVRSRIMKFDAPGFRDYKGLSLPDNLVADLVLKDYGIDPRDMPRPMDVFDTEPKGLNWNGRNIDPDSDPVDNILGKQPAIPVNSGRRRSRRDRRQENFPAAA